MGKFVITTRKNGEYQFNLKAGNGQDYTWQVKVIQLRQLAKMELNQFGKILKMIARYDRLESKRRKTWYFNLKAGNGQVIGKQRNVRKCIFKRQWHRIC